MERFEYFSRSFVGEVFEVKRIQAVLVSGVLIAVLFYLRRFRTQLFDRAFVVFAGILGSVFILKPEWTTLLAEKLGVGRGADLVMYLSIVALLIFCLSFWAKSRELDARLTALIRDQALSEASKQVPPGEKKS